MPRISGFTQLNRAPVFGILGDRVNEQLATKHARLTTECAASECPRRRFGKPPLVQHSLGDPVRREDHDFERHLSREGKRHTLVQRPHACR